MSAAIAPKNDATKRLETPAWRDFPVSNLSNLPDPASTVPIRPAQDLAAEKISPALRAAPSTSNNALALAEMTDLNKLALRGVTPQALLSTIDGMMRGFDKKISALEERKSPHQAQDLMREYLAHIKSLVEAQLQGNVAPAATQARMELIEKRLTAGVQVKALRFEEFKGHVLRAAKDSIDTTPGDEQQKVMDRVTEQLPRVFIASRFDRGNSASKVSRHGTRHARENYLAESEIPIDRAMTALDAMAKAGFPFNDRDKSILWISTFMAESGLDPRNVGDGGVSWGIGQVHRPSHPRMSEYPFLKKWEDLFDPYKNMLVCASISGNWTTIKPFHASKVRGPFVPAAEQAYDLFMQQRAAGVQD